MSHRTIIAIYVILAIGLVMPLCDAMVDGTAIIAIRTKDPWPGLGHVGVAFKNEDGTWTYGAIEGPPEDLKFLQTYRKEIIIPWLKFNKKDIGAIKDIPIPQIGSKTVSIPWINNLWIAYVRPNSGIENGGWVQGKGVDDKLMTEEDVYSKFGSWPYDKIKKISVPIAHPDKAIEEIKKFPNNGFLFISNNCLDNSLKVLKEYGVKDLPSYPSWKNPLSYPKIINIVPRIFFDRVTGDLYSWDSSKNEYTSVESPTPTAIELTPTTKAPSIEVASVNERGTWKKTFGGSSTDTGVYSQQTSDGGYVTVGSTRSYGSGVWLIKTDKNGNEIWNRTFGSGIDFDFGRSVQQTSDGGYIIGGWTKRGSDIGFNIWLIKTDGDGNMLWDKTLTADSVEAYLSVRQTTDGGYIMTSNMRASISSGGVLLIKTDSSGNMLWEKTFGESSFDSGISIQQTSDEGYIITGTYHPLNENSPKLWLIKTDPSGNMQWDKTFGESSDFVAGNSVQQTDDDGYIIVGYRDYDSNTDIWLIKTDSDGNIVWDNRFDGSGFDVGESVQQIPDDGYIISGWRKSSLDRFILDLWLIKTDSNGNKLWDKTFTVNTDYDGGNSVLQTIDGGYIIACSTSTGSDRNVLLIKTDSDGNV